MKTQRDDGTKSEKFKQKYKMAQYKVITALKTQAEADKAKADKAKAADLYLKRFIPILPLLILQALLKEHQKVKD